MDRHRDPRVNIRAPAKEQTDAQRALARRGRTLQDFVRACLRAVKADPDRFLRHLEGHWPEPKRRGRPPKDEAPAETPGGPCEFERETFEPPP